MLIANHEGDGLSGNDSGTHSKAKRSRSRIQYKVSPKKDALLILTCARTSAASRPEPVKNADQIADRVLQRIRAHSFGAIGVSETTQVRRDCLEAVIDEEWDLVAPEICRIRKISGESWTGGMRT